MNSTRRVVVILGAGGRSAPPSPARSPASPDRPGPERPERAGPARDRRRPAGRRRGRGRHRAGRRQRLRAGRGRRQTGGGPLRPAGRADQQRRRPLAQRPDPQPRHCRLGAGVPVNVLGPVHGIRAAVPVMRAQRSGSIILTASVAGMTAWSHSSPYCVTKAGVIQLAKVAAVEYARDHIRVNCVCPGTFLSAMHAGLPAEAVDAIAAKHPLGLGRPTTSSAPTPTWPATLPGGRPARPSWWTAATLPLSGRPCGPRQQPCGPSRGYAAP